VQDNFVLFYAKNMKINFFLKNCKRNKLWVK